MKAHLTGYFLTYGCVYLLDSACKGCSLQFFKLVLFSRIMFLKSDLFYFVLVLNVLETVKLVPSAVYKILSSLYIQQVRVFVIII